MLGGHKLTGYRINCGSKPFVDLDRHCQAIPKSPGSCQLGLSTFWISEILNSLPTNTRKSSNDCKSGLTGLATGKFPTLIRWSIQEIRRIAQRLAQRRINPAYIIAWSLWRRAHQAAAQKSHLK